MATLYKSYRGNPARLEEDLRKGQVFFIYRKQNGRFRYAKGSIPNQHEADMGVQGAIFRYWDHARADWRSFYVYRLL